MTLRLGSTAIALALVLGAVALPVRAAEPAAPLSIAIDPRVELLCILNRLAGPQSEYHQAFPSPYVADVDAHFARFANDPAVVLTRRVRQQAGISFDAPMALAVHLDLSFRARVPWSPLPSGLDARWKKVAIDEYVKAVRAFAERSGFDAFFAAHQAYYDAVVARYHEPVDREGVVTWFDGFFGAQPQSTYHLVPGLLTGPCNYGPAAQLPDGTRERYQIVELANAGVDGLPRPTTTGLLSLLVHEIAHSYVNPVFDRHAGELSASGAKIFPLVADAMREQAYGSWQTVVKESGVRAVTILFMADRFGPEGRRAQARVERQRSFVWADELAQRFDQYRHAKKQWPDFEAFVPEVVRFFDAHAAAYAHGLPPMPFDGPINAAGARSHHVGPDGSGELARFVASIRKRLGDIERDDVNLVLYGSPQSNPALSRVVAASGWKVTEAGVSVAGRDFPGAHLVLIACRPQPENQMHGVLVYAAGKDDDVVGINSLFHGPTDWVVARRVGPQRFEEVASGNFARNADDTLRLDAEQHAE